MAPCVDLPTPRQSISLRLPSPRSWLASSARSSLLSALPDAIRVGHLTISDDYGSHSYGRLTEGCNDVHITVLNDSFWVRMIFQADLGFSEAYMFNDIECSDLRGAMYLWLENRDSMAPALSSTFARLSAAISAVSNSFFGQSKAQAKLNAMASYDQSNELFKNFLSKEMMYSCALWTDAHGGVRGDLIPTSRDISSDLENAQLNKIHYVLSSVLPFTTCDSQPRRLLEFGSGWGAMSIVAASKYGCEVDTLTLSIEQKALAEERIREAGLEGKVRVHLMDYRDVPAEWENAFDAFVSIEMIEHVGPKYYSKYFSLVDFCLKKQNAVAVVTSSTFPEARFTGYQSEDFMRRYMWPNSTLPSATSLIQAAASLPSPFTLERIENHAAHYPRTLREWDRRLEKNITYEWFLSQGGNSRNRDSYEAFKKKWRYQFAYAGAGFSKGYITCHMLVFKRTNDIPERCD